MLDRETRTEDAGTRAAIRHIILSGVKSFITHDVSSFNGHQTNLPRTRRYISSRDSSHAVHNLSHRSRNNYTDIFTSLRLFVKLYLRLCHKRSIDLNNWITFREDQSAINYALRRR